MAIELPKPMVIVGIVVLDILALTILFVFGPTWQSGFHEWIALIVLVAPPALFLLATYSSKTKWEDSFRFLLLHLAAFIVASALLGYEAPSLSWFARTFALIVAIVEIIILFRLVRLVWRFVVLRRSGVSGGEAIRAVTQDLQNHPLILAMVAELSILAYALHLNTPRRPLQDSAKFEFRIPPHRNHPYVVGVVALITVIEIPLLHLVLARYSEWLAWILTILGIYAILWFLGDFNSVRHRISVATSDSMVLRNGLRWSMNIPRASIFSLMAHGSPSERQDVVLHLATPAEMRLLFGIRREVNEVSVQLNAAELEGLGEFLQLQIDRDPIPENDDSPTASLRHQLQG